MPRYEYRPLTPSPAAEKNFLSWIEQLDGEFQDKDSDHRSDVVRDTLHQIYLGRDITADPAASPAEAALVHTFDPRNATLEPEYYGDADAAKYAERKPLIWFWMMFDRSPLGLNHWLGFRMRAMLARTCIQVLREKRQDFSRRRSFFRLQPYGGGQLHHPQICLAR